MLVDSVIEYERIWVEGLNRGDASAADAAFLPDCIVHVTGVPEPRGGGRPDRGPCGGRESARTLGAVRSVAHAPAAWVCLIAGCGGHLPGSALAMPGPGRYLKFSISIRSEPTLSLL